MSPFGAVRTTSLSYRTCPDKLLHGLPSSLGLLKAKVLFQTNTRHHTGSSTRTFRIPDTLPSAGCPNHLVRAYALHRRRTQQCTPTLPHASRTSLRYPPCRPLADQSDRHLAIVSRMKPRFVDCPKHPHPDTQSYPCNGTVKSRHPGQVKGCSETARARLWARMYKTSNRQGRCRYNLD